MGQRRPRLSAEQKAELLIILRGEQLQRMAEHDRHMMQDFGDISVVIPVAPGDEA